MPLDFSLFWEKELTESKQSLQRRTHISWKNYVLQNLKWSTETT